MKQLQAAVEQSADNDRLQPEQEVPGCWRPTEACTWPQLLRPLWFHRLLGRVCCYSGGGEQDGAERGGSDRGGGESALQASKPTQCLWPGWDSRSCPQALPWLPCPCLHYSVPEVSGSGSHPLHLEVLKCCPCSQETLPVCPQRLSSHCPDIYPLQMYGAYCAETTARGYPVVSRPVAVCLHSKQKHRGCYPDCNYAVLKHLEKPKASARMLFLDFSSAFN